MDDFDNLNSKTDSDLRQIAVAFGDFTPEEAESKTRDELIMAITGAKDIGDVTVVDLAEDPVPVKPIAIPEAMTSTENTKSLDELIVDVGRTARFETNELADAILKAERSEEKKVVKKEPVAEEITEVKPEEKAAEKKTEKKTAKKTEKKPARTAKKAKSEDTTAKADEATETAEPAVAEIKTEASSEQAVEKTSAKADKKPATKAKKAKGGKKKDADTPAEDAKTLEPTPVEALSLRQKQLLKKRKPLSLSPKKQRLPSLTRDRANTEDQREERSLSVPARTQKLLRQQKKFLLRAKKRILKLIFLLRSRSKVFLRSTITKATKMISADSSTDTIIFPVKKMLMFPASSLREWA